MKYIQEELHKPFCVAMLSMVSKFKIAILAWFLVSSAQIISGMVSLSHGIFSTQNTELRLEAEVGQNCGAVVGVTSPHLEVVCEFHSHWCYA